jgi:LmbE family N-acetylglucosaminyl deacetylase
MDRDPSEIFAGRVLIAVPHMDDGVLACGGTLARLPDPARVHVVYATDGSRSPAPLIPWLDAAPADLAGVRAEEARAAMGHLGVPPENLHFLGLPDSRLRRHLPALESALRDLVRRLRPDHLLAPFRYDRNPDHLAVNRAATGLLGRGGEAPLLSEYFVYYRWRMLPGGDLRDYIDPDLLMRIEIGEVSRRKREALSLFRSQTTRYCSWQRRPNLTAELLDEVSGTPEIFLRSDPERSGAAVFTRLVPWIRVAHRLEPALKKRKDQVVALLRRGFASRA